MTEARMQYILATRLFDWYSDRVFLNCCFPWEMDVFRVTAGCWGDEIEIKTSVSDFKNETKSKSKIRKHTELVRGIPAVVWDANSKSFKDDWGQVTKHHVRRFWFAVPAEIASNIISAVPEHAGLITVRNERPEIFKKAPTLSMAKKIEGEQMTGLLTNAYLRTWRKAVRQEVDAERKRWEGINA